MLRRTRLKASPSPPYTSQATRAVRTIDPIIARKSQPAFMHCQLSWGCDKMNAGRERSRGGWHTLKKR